jgi:hypothetical protein
MKPAHVAWRDMPVRLLWMLACLMLASCASFGKARTVYVPPKIDCAAFDVPRVKRPTEPSPDERATAIWQLHAWDWQAYAEDVLNQRVETAACLKVLQKAQVIR